MVSDLTCCLVFDRVLLRAVLVVGVVGVVALSSSTASILDFLGVLVRWSVFVVVSHGIFSTDEPLLRLRFLVGVSGDALDTISSLTEDVIVKSSLGFWKNCEMCV